VKKKAEALSKGIMALDLAPEVEAEDNKWRFIGIQSKNRAEWVTTNLANMHQGITTVALYDTLGPDAAKFVFNQTGMSTVFCSYEFISSISKMKMEDTKSGENKMVNIKNLVIFEENIRNEDKSIATEAGLEVHTMSYVIFKGEEAEKAGTATIRESTPDDVYMFSYTSGTTGDPKGVKLTHKMIITAAYAINYRVGNSGDPFGPTDTYVSYLPAAHSFEQCCAGIGIIYGMRAGFFAGNVQKLTDDIQTLKPTFFPSVPRLYNRIYSQIQGKIKEATGMKGYLVQKAVADKLWYLRNDQGLVHSLYDPLVFQKMKDMLGGNVRAMITGSAPISGDVLDFLKICFCCPIYEGYGMTETCAGSVTTFANDPTTGIVGGPLMNVKVRLRDIPEMNYLSTSDPPKGEVMFWGPGITKGYFKNPEKTAEAFHGEWLLSGDVGQVNPNGSMKIVDRAKNIFKLSQGEYIAPEKLENVYITSQFVGQIWVYGDSLRDYIISFIVIDPAQSKKWCVANGVEWNNEDATPILTDPKFKQAVLDDFNKLAAGAKLSSLEKPKNLTLLLSPWTEQNDMLTPTQKLKRNIATLKLKEDIDRMYNEPIMKPTKK